MKKLEELEKQKKLALAEMEIDEEEEDIVEEEMAVRCLEDLPDADSEDITHFTDDDRLEPFPMDEDEPLQFPDSDEDEPKAAEYEPKAVEYDEGLKSEPKPVSEWVLNHLS
jgi:hypothetical protein